MASPRIKSRFSFGENVWIVIQIIAALSALILGVVSAINGIGTLNAAQVNRTAGEQQQISSIRNDITTLKSDMARVSEDIKALSQVPEDVKVASQLNSLNTAMSDLRTRFREIEQIIIADPSKAIELPLMRKDLDSIREINRSEITALRQDIERAYTLIIGTIIALALAVLAIAVTNIFKKERSIE